MGKKLEKAAKGKDCDVIRPWIKGIANHIYVLGGGVERGQRKAESGQVDILAQPRDGCSRRQQHRLPPMRARRAGGPSVDQEG